MSRPDKLRIALSGRDRERLIGLCGRKIGFGLCQLLVEVGRIDRGQELARLHMRANILLPGFQIAADPRIDRGLVEGLDAAGQDQALLRIAGLDLCERDRWYRLRIRPSNELLLAAGAADDASGRDGARCRESRERGKQQPAAARGADGWWQAFLGHDSLHCVKREPAELRQASPCSVCPQGYGPG